MSIEYGLSVDQGSIKGIVRHLNTDAFSTHGPISLQNPNYQTVDDT